MITKNLNNIRIYTCSLTGKIYAGYLNRGEDFNRDRVPITDQALTAVITYMDRDDTPREISCAAGTLKWIPNEEGRVRY